MLASSSASGKGSGGRSGGRANDTPKRRSVSITNKTKSSANNKNGKPNEQATPKLKPKRRVVKVYDPDAIQDDNVGNEDRYDENGIEGDDGFDDGPADYLFDEVSLSISKPPKSPKPSKPALPRPPKTAAKPQSKRQTQDDIDENDISDDENFKASKQSKPETLLWDPKKHPRNTTEFIGSYTHPPIITTKPSSNDVVPEIAFVGRSNIGKSSMVNMITGRKKLAIVSKTPGRTQFINIFMIKDQRDKVYAVADLPGYGFAKMSKEQQKDIAKFISEYLANRQALKLTILLVDIRNKPAEQDLRFMDVLTDLDLPFLVVATKCDRMKANEREQCLNDYSQLAGLDASQIISSSSETGEGKQVVLTAMMDAMFGGAAEGVDIDEEDDSL